MTPILVFDLETIPDIEGLRRLHQWGAEVSDAEVAERAFAARKELTGTTFLPHHLQRVAVVGCVFRDDKGFRVRCLGQADDTEPVLLSSFFKTIERYTPKLISWNGSGFDLPVLHYRTLIHGIAAPRYWDMGEDDKEFKWNNYISRYHSRHTDLMDLLAMYQGRANAPLDDMAQLCGFPGKLGMDGSKVWDAYQNGEIEAIRNYCETDVVNTYLVYLRFQLMRGQLNQAAYEREIALVRDTLNADAAPHWQEFMAAWKS
jgi:predicted PolB exonuclease-like 3'-5' exonuclease